MLRHTIALVAFVVPTVAACSERYEPDPKFSPASREMDPGERLTAGELGLESIANTRCDQEVLCDNVGKGKRFTNRAACVASFQRQSFEELGLNQCDGKIDPDTLTICLNSVRMLSCHSTFEDVYLLNECQSAMLCKMR